jgi:hypothetical protein
MKRFSSSCFYVAGLSLVVFQSVSCDKKKDYSGTAKCDVSLTAAAVDLCTSYNWSSEKQKDDPTDDVNSTISSSCLASDSDVKNQAFTASSLCTANALGSCSFTESGDNFTASATMYISGTAATAGILQSACSSSNGTYTSLTNSESNPTLEAAVDDASSEQIRQQIAEILAAKARLAEITRHL